MVAAWIRAETGVGPSMASGSQTWRGNWALLPMVPQKMQRVAAVSRPPERRPESMPALTPSKLRDLVAAQSRRMPIMNPKSPMRLVRKAFLAASAALFFVYQ